MNRLGFLTVFMVTVGAGTAVPQTRADEAAIKESFRTFEKAFAIADVEGMLAGIDERAVFAWGQLEVIGRDAIRQQFMQNVESGWKGGRATHRFSGIEFLSPTIAIAARTPSRARTEWARRGTSPTPWSRRGTSGSRRPSKIAPSRSWIDADLPTAPSERNDADCES